MTRPADTKRGAAERKERAVSPSRQKVVGVLGGMGPLATADFYTKLVRLTPARADQDHLRVIIDSNPKIPDRTAALRGEGPDPTEALVATAREAIAVPLLDGTEVLAAAAVRAALSGGPAEEFPGPAERSSTLRSPGMVEVRGTPRAGSSKPAGRP